jgi:glycosyltransferase involved in cell wall biosynthesis
MDEPELLPRTLLCLATQTYRRFKVVICVNQPDSWWLDQSKIDACCHNKEVLEMLQRWTGGDLVVLDYSSPGKGWIGKRYGVGYARKAVMDFINEMAEPEDVVVSLDADTIFSQDYLLSVARNFAINKTNVALSVPYYHHATGDELTDRAMLRYEIYMRHYFLGMARIGSPYTFAALGSAMAFPVSSYRSVGGMTPKLSGEDFYFLQKLTKFGRIGLWNDEIVNPEARFSDRVFFGTGPAMIKGAAGDWASYPIYSCTLFDQIQETYQLIPQLFKETVRTPVISFMEQTFKEEDPLLTLRKNHRDLDHFIRAFHEKFDGLRILQYLKTTHDQQKATDEENLAQLFGIYYNDWYEKAPLVDFGNFSFAKSEVAELLKIREFLFDREMEYRRTTSILQ